MISRRDDPSWAFYTNTVLRFPGHGVVVDLRRDLTTGEASTLRGLGLGERFGVVTPFNPMGRTVGHAENLARLEHLGRRLAETRVRAARCDGGDPEGTHQELGFAVGQPREIVRQMGIELGQSAVFDFDGERFWLVPALAVGGAEALPRRREG